MERTKHPIFLAILLGGVLACGDDDAAMEDAAMADAATDAATDAAPPDAAIGDTGRDAPTDVPTVDVADTSDAGGDAPEGFTLQVSWTPCSLISEGTDMRAECADIEVPLHWSDPEGDKITIFLKRHRGTPGGGQVWMLPGGPGQTGADLEPLVDQLTTVNGARSYYMIDHRGVGRSTRLRCASSEGVNTPNSVGLGEGEIEFCLRDVRAEWTDEQLAGFSSTGAAHDVGRLIEHLREGDETVSLWGGSYGTLWLERYLNLYTDQPDSIVFSAIALDVDLLSVDLWVDDVTRRWLDACDGDAECGARFTTAFGQSARDIITETFSGADQELCPDIAAIGLTAAILKPFFGQLFGSIEGRSLYGPIVYRIARCQPEDVAAITQLVTALSPPGLPQIPYGVRNWGFVLSENIAISELTSDRTDEEIRADYDNAVAVQGPTPRLAESRALWPRYEAPPFTNSDYQGPLLMVHGEYDFLPPSAYQRTVDHYLANNPNADFLLVPGAPHSGESPTTGGGQCAIELIVARLLDPDAPIVDCGSDVLPLVFEPPAALSAMLFGTDDPWDGVPTAMARRLDVAPRVTIRSSHVNVLGDEARFSLRRPLPRLTIP